MRVVFLNYYTLSWNGSPFAQNSYAPETVRPGFVRPPVLFAQGPFALIFRRKKFYCGI